MTDAGRSGHAGAVAPGQDVDRGARGRWTGGWQRTVAAGRVLLAPACDEGLDDLDVAVREPQLGQRAFVHVAEGKSPLGVFAAVAHRAVVPNDHADEWAMAGGI